MYKNIFFPTVKIVKRQVRVLSYVRPYEHAESEEEDETKKYDVETEKWVKNEDKKH